MHYLFEPKDNHFYQDFKQNDKRLNIIKDERPISKTWKNKVTLHAKCKTINLVLKETLKNDLCKIASQRKVFFLPSLLINSASQS